MTPSSPASSFCVMPRPAQAREALVDQPSCRCTILDQQELANRFVGWKVVEAADLTPDDQQLWKSQHADLCPGAVGIRFEGGRGLTCVLLLAREEHGRWFEQVVVISDGDSARTVLGPHETASLGVLVKARPGRYSHPEDPSNEVAIQEEAVLLSYPEKGAMLIYFDDGEYRNLVVSE